MNSRLLISFTLLISVVFVFGFAQVSSAEPAIEFEGRYWLPDLSAEGKVTEAGVGTDINFKSDLGVDDENFLESRLTWYAGSKNRLRLVYAQVDYSGDNRLERTIDFSGKSYTSAARVLTELEVNYLRLGWTYQFVDIAEGKLKFGPLVEAKGFWIDASLEAPDLAVPIKESEEFTVGLPTLGVALDINPLESVNLFAEVSGMTAGDYGYFFDAEAGIKIAPLDNLSIVAGYRVFKIEAEDDPDYANLDISGLFLGAALRF